MCSLITDWSRNIYGICTKWDYLFIFVHCILFLNAWADALHRSASASRRTPKIIRPAFARLVPIYWSVTDDSQCRDSRSFGPTRSWSTVSTQIISSCMLILYTILSLDSWNLAYGFASRPPSQVSSCRGAHTTVPSFWSVPILRGV